MSRQAASYRDRRVLLAGDAAHVHSAMGRQGLNTGVQDAVNLGWKLAQVVSGTSPESLLDTYHAERHPVAARVLRNTVCELLSLDEPRKRIAGMICGLDIQYDFGEGHPLLLHQARPVLLNLGKPAAFDIAPWADRVQLVDATYDGTWELPVLGAVTAPTAVLIRPDGHVAWVADSAHQGLPNALTTWFGPP